MPAFTVAAQEENFVIYIGWGLVIQLDDLAVKAFPLGEVMVMVLLVCRIGPVDESEVGGRLDGTIVVDI